MLMGGCQRQELDGDHHDGGHLGFDHLGRRRGRLRVHRHRWRHAQVFVTRSTIENVEYALDSQTTGVGSALFR